MSLPVFWEKFKGVIIGLILTLILFRLHPNFDSSIRVIQDIPTFTTCIFGFMLTLLGIIIQGNGNVIVKMKNNMVIYPRFLSLTKRVIVISLWISVFAFILGAINPSWWKIQFESYPTTEIIIKELSFMTLIFFCIWLIVDLAYFIHLFFLLIRTEK